MKPTLHHFYAFLLAFLFCSSALLAQKTDTIFWKPGNKLSWEDFRGEPKEYTSFKALTTSGILYTLRYRKTILAYTVDAFFITARSWKITGTGDSILQHEQGHFDITEIYARKMRKAFKELSVTESITIRQKAEAAAEAIIAEKNDFQKRYDEETEYGTNAKKQLEWKLKITLLLSQYQDYKN